uniref:Hypotheticial protein n=1 Tax=Schistosoma japonicum TaxID=6182 RepID=C1L8G8_SCHJA|nr:hypotheticial protein [Schistosoma japonicum]
MIYLVIVRLIFTELVEEVVSVGKEQQSTLSLIQKKKLYAICRHITTQKFLKCLMILLTFCN